LLRTGIVRRCTTVCSIFLNAAGDPEPAADVVAWGEWFETANRVVRCTRIDAAGHAVDVPRRGESIPGCVYVSTVFLGLDHNWTASGPPVLWETMIFDGPRDGETHRYRSRQLAMLGHAAAVGKVQRIPAVGDDPRTPTV